MTHIDKRLREIEAQYNREAQGVIDYQPVDHFKKLYNLNKTELMKAADQLDRPSALGDKRRRQRNLEAIEDAKNLLKNAREQDKNRLEHEKVMAAAEADQKNPIGNGKYLSQADIMTGSGDANKDGLGIDTGLLGSKSGISVDDLPALSTTNRRAVGLGMDGSEEGKQDMFDKMFLG